MLTSPVHVSSVTWRDRVPRNGWCHGKTWSSAQTTVAEKSEIARQLGQGRAENGRLGTQFVNGMFVRSMPYHKVARYGDGTQFINGIFVQWKSMPYHKIARYSDVHVHYIPTLCMQISKIGLDGERPVSSPVMPPIVHPCTKCFKKYTQNYHSQQHIPRCSKYPIQTLVNHSLALTHSRITTSTLNDNTRFQTGPMGSQLEKNLSQWELNNGLN